MRVNDLSSVIIPLGLPRVQAPTAILGFLDELILIQRLGFDIIVIILYGLVSPTL